MTAKILIVSLLASTLAAQTPSQPPAQPSPRPLTNLQILPRDSTRRDVINVMRSFAMGLGVRCQHCHVYKGDNPDDLSTFDFASDEKPAKATARTMMRMTDAINTDLLKSVGEPAKVGELVTCYTCHRGERKPLTQRPQPSPTPAG